jgi:spermidine synthase
MRPPKWKQWLSHLIELHIESASSDHNPHLYVSLNKGRYQLCTANAIYSFEDRYSNYRKAFTRVDLDRLPGKEVLILGFGLGSIPIMLEKIFDRDLHYTAVEIDEAVIDLASKYALPEIDSSVELICTDALIYVAQQPARFDMICVDIFLDDVVPDVFEQEAFLLGLKNMLNPDGLLLYNRLAATEEDKSKSEEFYVQNFLPVFPLGAYIDVGGNYMLLNDGEWLG